MVKTGLWQSELEDWLQPFLEGFAHKLLIVDDTALVKKGRHSAGVGASVLWRAGQEGQLSESGLHDVGAARGAGAEELWLVCEARAGGERRHCLSNLPAPAEPLEVARLVTGRWACEQAHQQMKQELGLDHFEGRSWLGLHYHALLVMVAHCFLRWLRLKDKKGVSRRGRRPNPACPKSPEPFDA